MHPVGYHWRNRLRDELLCYIKRGIEDGFPNERDLSIYLDNLLRGYVPSFSPTTIPSDDYGKWICWRQNLDWWGSEIEQIGKKFAEASDSLNADLVKKIFKDHGWETEKPVCGISLLNKTGKWRYDAFKERKDKIAVEVELTNRSSIFKDAFKFLIGQAMGQIDVGIIMVRKSMEKKGQPYFKWIDRVSHPIFSTLPMVEVAFHGFDNKPSIKERDH